MAEPWEHVGNPSLSTSLLTPLVLIPAVLIAVIVVIFGARRVIRPLQQLEAQAARAGQGDYAALAQPISGISEIQTLHATLAQMADQLRSYQRSLQSYAADVLRGQEDERIAAGARTARRNRAGAHRARSTLATDRAHRAARSAGGAGQVDELRALTAGTIEEVRRVIHDLRPIYLEDLGLVPAIEMLTQSLHQPDRLAASLHDRRRDAPPRAGTRTGRVSHRAGSAEQCDQARAGQTRSTFTCDLARRCPFRSTMTAWGLPCPIGWMRSPIGATSV